MFKKELIIPALLGLGLYAQTNEINLANNTTILLLLFVVLEDHAEVEKLKYRIAHIEREICTDYCHDEKRRFNSRNGHDCCYHNVGWRGIHSKCCY